MKHRNLALQVFLSLSLLATACANAPEPAPASGTGSAYLALTGALPGVAAYSLSIYDGAVSDIGAQSPTYTPLQCAAYQGAVGNSIKLQYLKASSNYTILVDFFSDAACKSRVGFGWRGRVEVSGGTDGAASIPTYYVQPYFLSTFTGLAAVSPALQDKAKLRSCTTRDDCTALHPDADCNTDTNKCEVNNLFPLNGGAPRVFANAVSVADGGVALVGGLTKQQKSGTWIAANYFAEVFDPMAGYFQAASAESEVDGVAANSTLVAVGLASAVTDTTHSIVMVGGSLDTNFALDPGKSLSTALDATDCSKPGAVCPVQNQIQRWDLQTASSETASLVTNPGALSVVARVHGKSGDRILVAGGAVPPLPKLVDPRQSQASLCEIGDKLTITCPSSGARSMTVGRANAASACLAATADGACTQLLLLGGRKQGNALAEIYDADADTFTALPVKGDATLQLHGGRLHKLVTGKWLLVGASTDAVFLENDQLNLTAALQPPTLVDVTLGATPSIQLTPVDMGAVAGTDGGKRLFATSVSLRDGTVLLVGGIDPSLQAAPDAIRFDGTGKPIQRHTLTTPRIGATSALVGGSTPLGGCAFVSGGFRPAGGGTLTAQNSVEVFCP